MLLHFKTRKIFFKFMIKTKREKKESVCVRITIPYLFFNKRVATVYVN